MCWLATFNALVFLALAGLHSYWALGGRQGSAAALPTAADGCVLHYPSAALTGAVALGLLAMAGLSTAHLALGPAAPGWLRWAQGSLALLLALRVVGDGRYVGLRKRVHDTTFARLDTRYYTPLCALLAASSAGLALGA